MTTSLAKFPMALADEALAAVSGAKKLYPFPQPKHVKQSNSVGDIYVDASCGGSVSISVTQSNDNG